MRLHFDRADVRKLLAHAKAAKDHAATYGQEQPIQPGLWLVGDMGIYLMSNGRPGLKAEPDKPGSFVVYARECHPTKMPFDRWYEVKRSAFGGDDGCDYIPATDIEAALADQSPTEPLNINLTPRGMSLITVTRTIRTP